MRIVTVNLRLWCTHSTNMIYILFTVLSYRLPTIYCPCYLPLAPVHDISIYDNSQHLAMRSHWKDHAANIARIIQFYSGDEGRAMVFCETKKDVDGLAACADIRQNKEKLHGGVTQAARENVLQVVQLSSVMMMSH